MPSPKVKKNPVKKQKSASTKSYFIVATDDSYSDLHDISKCCFVRATNSYEAIQIVSRELGMSKYPLVATQTSFYEERSDSSESESYERVMGSGSVDEISSESETA